MVDESFRAGVAQMIAAFWVLLVGFFFAVLLPAEPRGQGIGLMILVFFCSGFILWNGYRALVPNPPPEPESDQPSRMP